MASAEERIKEIEEELKKTKRNKATEHHIGLLLARLAKLKRSVLESKKKSGAAYGFDIKKEGDATVVMVGFPSVGKSTLLSRLTNAKSRIGAYEFTTLECIPGILKYKGLDIQVLDLPGIIHGASFGKGRGKEVLSSVRKADLILIVLDPLHPEHLQILKNELEGVGIRLNKNPPDISLKRKKFGGIEIVSRVKLTKLSKEMIISILNEYGYHNAQISFKEDTSPEELIDFLEGNRVYIRYLPVINKADLIKEKPKWAPEDAVYISAENNQGIEELKEKIFQGLNLIRVYTKKRSGEINFQEPMILKKGSTVEAFCKKLPRGFLEGFKYALVWGKSVKFPGQRVGLKHKLTDEDIVYIVKR